MKTAIITGASRGIGKEIAILLSKNGYRVLINYCNSEDKAISVMSEISADGGICDVFRADVKDENQTEKMVKYVLEKWGDIDLLVNNAGIQNVKLFTDFSLSEWKEMLDTHLTGAFNTCKAVMPTFIHKKSGKIINIASIWGEVGASCEVPYSTAKAGLIGFTKSLAKELAPSGITVNAVSPGVIQTDMINRFSDEEKNDIISEIPLGRIGKTSDIAEAVLFLAEQGNYITGQVISVNGGFAE